MSPEGDEAEYQHLPTRSGLIIQGPKEQIRLSLTCFTPCQALRKLACVEPFPTLMCWERGESKGF